jgi:hypothetical protein
MAMLATDIDDPFEVTHGASGVCEADFTVLHESRARIAADVAATASAAAAAAAAEAPAPPAAAGTRARTRGVQRRARGCSSSTACGAPCLIRVDACLCVFRPCNIEMLSVWPSPQNLKSVPTQRTRSGMRCTNDAPNVQPNQIIPPPAPSNKCTCTYSGARAPPPRGRSMRRTPLRRASAQRPTRAPCTRSTPR